VDGLAIYFQVRLPSAVNRRADRSAIDGAFPDTSAFVITDPHEQLAPKEKIRACEWFTQNSDLREKDGVTRAQRAKYAVQGELRDDAILREPCGSTHAAPV